MICSLVDWLWHRRIILAALVFLVFLILLAPVRLVSLVVKEIPQLTLSHLEGTVWRGRSGVATLQMAGESIDLGRLTWTFNPLMSIAGLSPTLHIESQNREYHLSADVQYTANEQLVLRNVQGTVSLDNLAPWLPVPLDAQLHVDIMALQLALEVMEDAGSGSKVLALDGEILLQQVTWLGAEQPALLGDYHVQLSLNDNRQVVLAINDKQALLGVTGQITSDLDDHYELDLRLQPKPGLVPAIENSIGLLGNRDADGAVRLTLPPG